MSYYVMNEKYFDCSYDCSDCAVIDCDFVNEAVRKQISLKPKYSAYGDRGDGEIIPFKAKCPTCEHEFEFGYWNDEDNHHCICGQKIDWSK